MTDSSKRHRVYDSAVDRWVAVLLAISPLMSIVIGIWLWFDGQSDAASVLFVSGALVTFVTVALTLPCRYTLLEDVISIRCGWFLFYQVAYDDLVSADPSTTLRSGPALSLKRVELATKGRTYIVSPKEQKKFLDDVRERIRT